MKSRSFVGLIALGLLSNACGSKGAPSASTEELSDAAPPATSPAQTPDAKRVFPIVLRADIFEKADTSSRNIGYLRLGQSIAASAKPEGGDGKCTRGFFAIAPRGYICADETVTTDPNDPVVRALGVKPDLSKPMPYVYGFVRRDATLWNFIPSYQEMDKHEFAFQGHLKEYAKNHRQWNKPDRGDPNAVPLDDQGNAKTLPKEAPELPEVDENALFPPLYGTGEAPWWLSADTVRGKASFRRKIPGVSTYKGAGGIVFQGRAYRHAGLAVIGSFRAGPKSSNRRFVVALDGRLIAEDKIKPHYASSFHGITLDEKSEFPLAIVRRPEAVRYSEDGHEQKSHVPFRDVISLTGKRSVAVNKVYWQTKAGYWVKEDDVGVFTNKPEWPKSFDYKTVKWIDICITYQTLTAYEGDKPVYATLVSSGRDGAQDPYTTRSTVRGEFQIKWKHVTATMDADDPDNRFELRDVPWVQYFEANFALHGAYWHDDFGRPRSHGCVNLAPIDARKLFMWTDPPLPDAWHAAHAGAPLAQGTWVRVRR